MTSYKLQPGVKAFFFFKITGVSKVFEFMHGVCNIYFICV